MALDEHAVVAFADIASAMPLADIIAAANDPSNWARLRKLSKQTTSTPHRGRNA
jgi:hypothetical protein